MRFRHVLHVHPEGCRHEKQQCCSQCTKGSHPTLVNSDRNQWFGHRHFHI